MPENVEFERLQTWRNSKFDTFGSVFISILLPQAVRKNRTVSPWIRTVSFCALEI